MMKRTAMILLVGALSGCGGEPVSQSAVQASQGAAASHPRGEEIYNNYCFSCHTPGLSGAPKLGDAEAWAPRIAKGETLLLQATIAGIAPAMPARGMCFDCSDDDLAAAIAFMVHRSGG